MTRNQRLANLEVDHMSAHNPSRHYANEGVDRTGYVPDHNQIILNDNLSPFPSVDGPEQSFILVENVETPYDAHVFYADKSLFNYFISRGLSKADAETLLPLAHRALSDLCEEFLNSAVCETQPETSVLPKLPETAPELFEPSIGRPKKGADVISFLRRVWKDPWIDSGSLTRADLGRLDPAANSALSNHLRNHALPDDLQILTLHESNSLSVPQEFLKILEKSDKKMLKTIRAITERELRLHA
jgi:hypothetical protein